MFTSGLYARTTATCEAFRIQSIAWQSSLDVGFNLENGNIGTMPQGWAHEGTMYASSIQGGSYEKFGIPSCGPRCGLLNITQISNLSDIHTNLNSWFYVCQSTVHQVEFLSSWYGSIFDYEKIPDPIASLAATSMSRGTAGDSVGKTYGYYPYE